MGCSSSQPETKRPTKRHSNNDIAFAKLHDDDGKKHFYDEYVLDKKISQGAFGQIHMAHQIMEKGGTVSKNLDLNRSVKIMDTRMKTKQICKLMQNEVHTWKSLGHHNNCVKLLDVKYEAELCFIIIEMCTGGLLPYLSRLPIVDERALGDTFAQMLLGIEFLHSSGIVHRDIKPDNFLIGGAGSRKIKICDFGLAKKLTGEKFTGECGTPLFMCPEMLLGCGYDEKADMWSFGVIAYALLFGRFPYDIDDKNSHLVKETIAVTSDPPDFETSVDLTDNAKKFVMGLLKRNARDRHSASDSLATKYMEAAAAHKHECGSNLPNLRPMMETVRQVRAFENKDLSTKSDIDDIINRRQMQSHGIPVPGVSDHSIVTQGLGSIMGLEAANKLGTKRNSLSNVELEWDAESSTPGPRRNSQLGICPRRNSTRNSQLGSTGQQSRTGSRNPTGGSRHSQTGRRSSQRGSPTNSPRHAPENDSPRGLESSNKHGKRHSRRSEEEVMI